MPSMKAVIKDEQAQMELRRSPSLVEDRLDEIKAFGDILMQAADTGTYDVEYLAQVKAHFSWALTQVVKFGTNAARMVQHERETRRDAVAEMDYLKRENSGLKALVDALQMNQDKEKQQAINDAVGQLAEFYGADVDELLQALKDATEAA